MFLNTGVESAARRRCTTAFLLQAPVQFEEVNSRRRGGMENEHMIHHFLSVFRSKKGGTESGMEGIKGTEMVNRNSE